MIIHMSGAYRHDGRTDFSVIKIQLVAEIMGVFNVTTGGRLCMEPQHIRGAI